MKKWISMLVLMTGLFMIGCIASGEKADDETDREELVLWTYYETEMQQEAMDKLVDGFNASQEKYHLVWEYHGPTNKFNKELAISITQNQLPDMVIIDNPDMLSYVEMGKFEDLTEYIEEMEGMDQYYENVLDSVTYDGRYYGMPFCCNNLGLIYNKDILKEENVTPPENWEELVAAAEKLTSKNRYGLAVSAIGGEESAFQFASFMLSAGDDLDEAGGEGTLKAFQLMSHLTENEWMSRECVNWSQNDVGRTFIAENCAMMINGPWVLPALNEASVNYGVVPFPEDERSQIVLGGEDIAVLKGKNVEGSITFFEYYNTSNVMLNINLMADSIPPRKDVAQQVLDIKPEYQVFMEQLQNCVNRTSYDKWPELSDRLSEGQYQILTGQSTAEEAAQKIKENTAN